MRSDLHYRDFPRRFWDADPDAVLDPRDPKVIRRLLIDGSIDEIARALDPAFIASRWADLHLPAPAAAVWARVLARLGHPVPHQ